MQRHRIYARTHQQQTRLLLLEKRFKTKGDNMDNLQDLFDRNAPIEQRMIREFYIDGIKRALNLDAKRPKKKRVIKLLPNNHICAVADKNGVNVTAEVTEELMLLRIFSGIAACVCHNAGHEKAFAAFMIGLRKELRESEQKGEKRANQNT